MRIPQQQFTELPADNSRGKDTTQAKRSIKVPAVFNFERRLICKWSNHGQLPLFIWFGLCILGYASNQKTPMAMRMSPRLNATL